VAENTMKLGPLLPKPGVYNFKEPDALVNFACLHKIKIPRHNLVWREQLPNWFASTVAKDNARKVMTDPSTPSDAAAKASFIAGTWSMKPSTYR